MPSHNYILMSFLFGSIPLWFSDQGWLLNELNEDIHTQDNGTDNSANTNSVQSVEWLRSGFCLTEHKKHSPIHKEDTLNHMMALLWRSDALKQTWEDFLLLHQSTDLCWRTSDRRWRSGSGWGGGGLALGKEVEVWLWVRRWRSGSGWGGGGLALGEEVEVWLWADTLWQTTC